MIGQLRCRSCFIFVAFLESEQVRSSRQLCGVALVGDVPHNHVIKPGTGWTSFRHAAYITFFYSLSHQAEGGHPRGRRSDGFDPGVLYKWTHFLRAVPLN